MKIYVLFIEYEIIDLVTTNKQSLIDRVNERGKLYKGDYVSVWEDEKRVAEFWTNEDFIKGIETNE